MPTRIDSIDKKVVALLQPDGRMPCAEIARSIGNVTKRVVRHRIKRMVEGGIITVSAVLSPAAIGYPVIADVWAETEASATPQIAKALTELDLANYLAYSTGDQNISLQLCARDIASLAPSGGRGDRQNARRETYHRHDYPGHSQRSLPVELSRRRRRAMTGGASH